MGMLDGRTCKAEAVSPDSEKGLRSLVKNPAQALPGLVVIHNSRTDLMASDDAVSFKFLTYHTSTVG